jgi:hypothetical protein
MQEVAVAAGVALARRLRGELGRLRLECDGLRRRSDFANGGDLTGGGDLAGLSDLGALRGQAAGAKARGERGKTKRGRARSSA